MLQGLLLIGLGILGGLFLAYITSGIEALINCGIVFGSIICLCLIVYGINALIDG